VDEAEGGVVDPAGFYTAPEIEGVYHVVATVDDASANQLSTYSYRRTFRSKIYVKRRNWDGVRISPKVAALESTGSIQFTASAPSTTSFAWSVEEGALGGTITEDGVYTAPEVPGTYHVVAHALSDATRVARATVTVANPLQTEPTPEPTTTPPSTEPTPTAPTTPALPVPEPTPTPTPASCTYSYSAWSACRSDGTQVRTSVSSTPSGCVGTPVLTQACVYTPPAPAACTYSYSAWSACQSNNTQTRTVTSATPSGCVGTPVVAQACVYTPPPPASVTGPQFYVATNGSDSNPGTSAAPWRTIQKAMNSATAGSTVNIRAGTYPERLTVNVSGTAGSYITFQPEGFNGTLDAEGKPTCGGYTGVACGGAAVILDYSSLGRTRGAAFLQITNKSYVRIQGFTFRGYRTYGESSQSRGVRIDGTGSHHLDVFMNRFLDNKCVAADGASVCAHDGANAFHHFYVWNATDVNIVGNEMGNIWTSYSEVLAVRGGAQRVLVGWNHVHDTDGIPIDTLDGASSTIRGNLVEFSGQKRDGSDFYPGFTAQGIYVDGGVNVTIERNTVRDTGWCIQADAEPNQASAHDIVVRNNVLARCYAGIKFGTFYGTPSKVYNNSAYNNTIYDSDNGIVAYPSSGTLVWKNNALVNNSNHVVASAGASLGTLSYNLYYSGGGIPSGDATRLTVNPQFMNPAAGDFRLSVTSPARNAGDPATTTASAGATDYTGNSRIIGGRIDVGAVEAN
jgi:hypothetical protein